MNDTSVPTGLRLLRAEMTGALSAAIVTVPQAIGYGLIAFAALGVGYTNDAVLLGLYSAIVAGLLTAMLGGTPIGITGPKAPLTILIAGLVAALAAMPGLPQDPGVKNTVITLLAAFCVLIAGLFQLILGLVRFGNIVKYVPHAVISGVMNGVAIWLILSQLRPLLGLPVDSTLSNMFDGFYGAQPLTLCVGIFTLAGIYIAKRYYKSVPPTLVGLLFGCAIYYLVHAVYPAATLGPTLGALAFQWPQMPEIGELSQSIALLDPLIVVPVILVTGLIVGLIASTESLLTSVVADNLTGSRHHSNRELVGQGLGNIACAAVGALPAAGSIPRTVANYDAGGRTRVSGILSAGIVFLVILILSPALGKLPLVVVAAIIIAVGVDLFDSWTTSLVKKLSTHAPHRRELLLELLITITVAALTVAVNLVAAVITGMVMASALVIWQLSKSIVRRQYAGDRVQSRKFRNTHEYSALANSGDAIRIFELQGPLFFGSADKLSAQIERSTQQTVFCILDMQRVTDVDGTGARILARTAETLRRSHKHLLITNLPRTSLNWGFLEMMGVIEAVGETMFFQDIDHALEWAEDRFLADTGDAASSRVDDIAQLDFTRGLTKTELRSLSDHLVTEKFSSSAHIFNEGEDNVDAFIVMRGSVSISKQMSSGSRKRLITFGPGSLLGELGFVDQRPRSATARADEDSELLRFSFAAFQALQKEQPELATKLLTNIAHEISSKLRRTSMSLAILEDS